MTQNVASGFEQPNLDDDMFATANDDTAAPSTVFDELMSAVQAPVLLDPVALKVPGRTGVTLMFDVNIDQPLVQMWRKRAADKKDPDGVNSLQFAVTVIANQCQAVYMNGQKVTTPDGKPLNFRTQAFLDMLGTPSAKEAVKALYGVDTHMLAVCNRIMEEAGYAGEDVDADDSPTVSSSNN